MAGLSAEIGIAESRNDLNILVLSKTDREESNTSWAQGGVAAVWDFSKDNFEKHMKDTLVAGDKLCDPEIVKTVVEEDTTNPDEMVLLTQSWKELRDIMSYYVGIVRTNISLTCALDRLHILYKGTEELYNSSKLSPQLSELRNLITVAYLICRAAQIRRESRGLHYDLDFPDKYDYLENTIL